MDAPAPFLPAERRRNARVYAGYTRLDQPERHFGCSLPSAVGHRGPVHRGRGLTARRTYVRMPSVTSDGSPYIRFKRALGTGNLNLIRAAAAELPHVGLTDALEVCLLMRDRDPVRFERAA